MYRRVSCPDLERNGTTGSSEDFRRRTAAGVSSILIWLELAVYENVFQTNVS